MPLVDRKGQWRAAIHNSEAAKLLREGQSLNGTVVRQIQSLTDILLQHFSKPGFGRAGIAPATRDCDAFLHQQLAELRGVDRAAALISCLHTLTAPHARYEVSAAMPATCPPDGQFETDIFAYLECIIQGRMIHTMSLRKYEATAAEKLQHVAALARGGSSDMFTVMWELLYAVGRLGEPGTGSSARYGGDYDRPDEHRDLPNNLFPDRLLFLVLSRERGRQLKETLDQLLSQKELLKAYRMVYALRTVYHLPRPRHILTTMFPHDLPQGSTPAGPSGWYHMWSVWSPDYERIRQWSESENEALQRHRSKLAPFFALEGPDISGRGSKIHRLSTPTNYFNEQLQPGDRGAREKLSMLESMLKDLDFAIKLGPWSVELLVQMYLAGEQHPIDHKVIERLEDALRLNNDEHCHTLYLYLHVVRHVGDMPLYERVISVAKALPVINMSAPLRARWGVDFNIGTLAPNLLRQAQRVLFGELLPRGQPSGPFAHAVWDLAQGLSGSLTLHSQWTQSFIGTLHGMPEFWKIQRALDAIVAPGATDDERQFYMEFLFDTLGREDGTISRSGSAPGPRPPLSAPQAHRAVSSASTSAGLRHSTTFRGLSPWPLRYSGVQNSEHDPHDDPLWHTPDLSAQEKDFREIILDTPDIPIELATRCMRQAVKERPRHLEIISQRLFNITDNSCIRLSTFLADLNKRDLLTDPCWADLLLHVLRVRNRQTGDLLGHVAGSKPAPRPEHFSRWISALHQVLGSRLMDSAGGMGFNEAKIQECERRIVARWSERPRDLHSLRTSSNGHRISTDAEPVLTPSWSEDASVSTPGTSIRSSIRLRDAYPADTSVTDETASHGSPSRGVNYPAQPSTVVRQDFDEEEFSGGRPPFSRQESSDLDEESAKLVRVFSDGTSPSTDIGSFRISRPPLPI